MLFIFIKSEHICACTYTIQSNLNLVNQSQENTPYTMKQMSIDNWPKYMITHFAQQTIFRKIKIRITLHPSHFLAFQYYSNITVNHFIAWRAPKNYYKIKNNGKKERHTQWKNFHDVSAEGASLFFFFFNKRWKGLQGIMIYIRQGIWAKMRSIQKAKEKQNGSCKVEMLLLLLLFAFDRRQFLIKI